MGIFPCLPGPSAADARRSTGNPTRHHDPSGACRECGKSSHAAQAITGRPWKALARQPIPGNNGGDIRRGRAAILEPGAGAAVAVPTPPTTGRLKEQAMRNLIVTIVVVVLLGIAGALGFIYSGVYNVAADSADNPLLHWALEQTRVRSIMSRSSAIEPPADLAAAERVARGLTGFESMCAHCHTAPGAKPTPVAKNLNPRPPEMQDMGKHLDPAYAFWAIKHGIRMTGMPAWGSVHSDDELWDLVAAIQAAAEWTPEQYQSRLAEAERQGHGHDHGAGADHDSHGDGDHGDGDHSDHPH